MAGSRCEIENKHTDKKKVVLSPPLDDPVALLDRERIGLVARLALPLQERKGIFLHHSFNHRIAPHGAKTSIDDVAHGLLIQPGM